ncbi:putative pectinesterase/pectinesterase inhibitor 64 [Hibiscus syriacus]|uniref:pectinesterase n=1 Tax=Hibiscus syriacus TaxID=106335 RepID=A0A6A3BZ39_HIBSY|nr:probable pectinesterase/pectinesterase inhibitor 51 [Hibiscus syriacus]KAE8721946.1 putative pectinesterase/pectinesterase inhibitor 64 [Hibiscus syriacus]
MAVNIIFLVCLFSFAVVSSAGVFHHGNAHVSVSKSSPIRHACQATRFPQLCETSLVLPPNPNPTTIQMIQSAISVSKDHLKKAQSMVADVSDSVTADVNHTSVVLFCVEMLSFSEYRMELVRDALTKGKIKDARAWMSAVHGYQKSSWGALKRINDAMPIAHVMSSLDTLEQISSNALSMMVAYDNHGENTASWTPPKTERDGFYEGRPGRKPELRFKGGVPTNLKVDVTVCKDHIECTYKTVQEAVNAAPVNSARRFVIRIRSGVYREIVRVAIEKKNVMFWGEGMGKTIITGSLNVHQPGIHTFNSPTVGVLGDGFMARDLTIENTAGSDGHQAVAFRSDSDMSVIENCEFIGNQDTLCSNSLRQFYKNCRIQGNVDFIFGTSASVFQDCLLLIAPRTSNPEKGDNNVITAHGRTDPAESTGFVFHNCIINGTEEYMRHYNKNLQVHNNYLGRPWKEYSRTVFIDCSIEKLVSPEGWTPWSGDIGLKTLFYGEFGNTGRGSDVSKRVPWSTQIPPQFVHTYSVENFIQGDEWIPK